MDVIKSERIGHDENLTLISFDCGGYEIQRTDPSKIIETDGIWDTKKSALIAFKHWKEQILLEKL
jgi:hypothetical protein